jgi:hypothetical protein
LIATSESGSLSVLQIDAARRRMRCIEQVCLPATSAFPDLWAGQTHAHLEPRRLYGRYLRVDSSGAAVAVASLDQVAILPVQHGGEHDRLFAAADSADMLPSRRSAPPTARVVECACEHVTGIVADLAFVQLGAQVSPRVGAAPTSPAALLYLAVLLLLEGKVTQKCFPRDVCKNMKTQYVCVRRTSRAFITGPDGTMSTKKIREEQQRSSSTKSTLHHRRANPSCV